MLYRLKIIGLAMAVSMALPTLAQEKWDLRKCVEYAISNNISVKQNEVQERLAKLTYLGSRDSRWPTASFNGTVGEQFGRNIDPATNQFTTNAISFANVGVNSNATLFNWFRIKNTIDANRLSLSASEAQTKKLQEDIALNVAAAYLQALLTFEQKRTAEVQAGQTNEQLQFTRKRVDAGSLPELNAAELEAQLARDSATVVTAESTYQLNLLQLKAILNLDASYPFDISTPDINDFPVAPLAQLQPADVYLAAVGLRPSQLANVYRLEAAKKNAKVAKAAMYPSFDAFGGLQSLYSSAFKFLPDGPNNQIIIPTTDFVRVAGNQYFVNTVVNAPEKFVKANFNRQMNYNFQQSIGLSLRVPIFNGNQARYGYRRALENQSNLELQMKADSLTLKQDIYNAYQNAVNALATYKARAKAYQTSSYSYSLGKKRYEVGLLPVFELITLQNNMLRAQIDQMISQYEYVFRTKILEFYKGTGITL
jgi:outer membrane protein